MSARVWTREELDEVWPLPEGWQWVLVGDVWGALWKSGAVVWVTDDSCHHFTASCETTPLAVAAAVIGAHLGHDSPEWMARELEAERDKAEDRLPRLGPRHHQWSAKNYQDEGGAAAFDIAAKMLRRGTVSPRHDRPDTGKADASA